MKLKEALASLTGEQRRLLKKSFDDMEPGTIAVNSTTFIAVHTELPMHSELLDEAGYWKLFRSEVKT